MSRGRRGSHREVYARHAGKMHWSESDFRLVWVNGAPGLLIAIRSPATAPD